MSTQVRESLISVDEAREIIFQHIREMETETAGVINALGKTIAEDVTADSDVPAFANSAVDGFAVIASNTVGACERTPVRLSVMCEIPVGTALEKVIIDGTVASLKAGAAIPKGTDAVVDKKDCYREDAVLYVMKEIKPGENIRAAGEDMRKGEMILSKGTVIGPVQMGILAALGKPGVAVRRKPKVAIITTGREFVDIVDELTAGQIRNSNRYSLVGQVLAAGCELGPLVHARDGKDSMLSALSKAARADVIITAGGTSLGVNDMVREAISRMGRIHLSRVAAKPGKPFYFATIDDKPVFALPGSPVASAIAFEVLVRPALLKILGRTALDRSVVSAALKNTVTGDFCQRQFLPARTMWEGGCYSVEIADDNEGQRLKLAAQVNSIAVVREDRGDLRRGEMVEVMLLDPYYQA